MNDLVTINELTFLTPSDLARMFKLHAATIIKAAENGTFPPPIMVGCSRRWHPDVIWQFIGGPPPNAKLEC